MSRVKLSRFIILPTILLIIVTGCSAKNQDTGSNTVTGEISSDAATSVPVRDENLPLIAGSGSNIPVTQALCNAYQEKTGIDIQIPPSIGTSGAIKALQANDIDIGLISRPLKDSEKEAGIKQKEYAEIGIVFGVNPSVPDDNLTSEDLINIYMGTKNKWSNGESIIVFIREGGDSSNKVLEEKIPGFSDVLKESLDSLRWEIMYTDQESSDAIRNTNYSIGVTDTTAVSAYSQSIKPLKFNGIEPTTENILNGSYSLYKKLYFAYKEPLSEQSEKFLEFVFSEEGRKIIFDNESIPLNGD
jgi:phosphate transport system substrate-binding protein